MLRHDRLSWYRWEWHDPWHPQYWGACTVAVYKPTYEIPHVSILVSLATGKGKAFFRAKSLSDLPFGITLPQEGRERLELALTKAQLIEQDIKQQLKMVMGAQRLEPGARIIRTDTGEVIAQAEEILGFGEPRSDGSNDVDRGSNGN